jgi:hypothetical protein
MGSFKRYVQFIMDNTVDYVVAGRMLMLRYLTLFWICYVEHCIDLILEDIDIIVYIKDIVESTMRIIFFIYILHLCLV